MRGHIGSTDGAQVRRRFRQRANRLVGNRIAAITALIGGATDFARSAGYAQGRVVRRVPTTSVPAARPAPESPCRR